MNRQMIAEDLQNWHNEHWNVARKDDDCAQRSHPFIPGNPYKVVKLYTPQIVEVA